MGGNNALQGRIKRTRQLACVDGFQILATNVAGVDAIGLIFFAEKIADAFGIIIAAGRAKK